MGAGILPVAQDAQGNLHFLFGKEAEDNRWGDFGGGRENSETQFETAIREGCEELDGFLGCGKTLMKRVTNNSIGQIDTAQYRTYLFRIDYDRNLPMYFNNHHRFIKARMPLAVGTYGMFEKSQIKWFTIAELRKKSSSFRPFYRKVLSQVLMRYG